MITIFLPITRKEFIPGMAKQLKALIKPEDHELNIVAIIDNIEIDTDETKSILSESGVKVLTCKNTGLRPAGGINIATRRSRITDTFNLARRYIPLKSDLVFTIEDDTLIEPSALLDLLQGYKTLPNVGLVSGVQVGRWGVKYIGVWKVDNVHDMTWIESQLPNPKYEDLWELVDTTGFYCFLVSAEHFRSVNNKFGQFGPDIYFGLELRKMGLQNYVNWRIIAKHISPKGLLVPDETCVQVRYEKPGAEWMLVKPVEKIKINL